MDIYTMDRNFHKDKEIDVFDSAIWTERYYGDGEVVLVVPLTKGNLQVLAPGTLIGESDSDEPMILETNSIEDKLTVSGITLTKWLNNRFIKSSPVRGVNSWTLRDVTAGRGLTNIVQNWCIDSVYLTNPGWHDPGDGTHVWDDPGMGIDDPARLKVPGLQIGGANEEGSTIFVDVPFGPVYDALRNLAEAYGLGMQITYGPITDSSYTIWFRSYRGLDRTSDQSVNSLVRFSSDLDSLVGTKEFQSIQDYITIMFAFAPQLPGAQTVTLKISNENEATAPSGAGTGFDLRAAMLMAEDITPEMIAVPPDDPTLDFPSTARLLGILYNRALTELSKHPYAKLVDGQVVSTNMFQYKRDYNLGDIIEIEGNTGVLQKARVMEYIRSKDSTGERAYPTLSTID